MLKHAAWLVALGMVACGSEITGHEHSDTPTRGTAAQPIVAGTTSTPAQDAIVILVMPDELCSGTLIAPNLVLTARHCVEQSSGAEPSARPTAADECEAYSNVVAASTIAIHAGINGNPDIHRESQAIARAQRITVPRAGNACSFDVALIQLDRDIPGAQVAPVRFGALAANEPTVAVGYGIDGNGRDTTQREQRATTVLGVGPTSITYTTKRGLKVTYKAPEGDVVSGEATCLGDSGGPLLDAQGRVVAVTSRGIPFLFPEDQAQFGPDGCIDQPSVYAGVRFNEQLIRDAAKAAGHELPASDATPATADSPTAAADESSGADKPTKKKSKSSEDAKTTDPSATATGLACTSSPRSTTSGALLPLVGLALAAGALRRRRGVVSA